jgi:L,D-transpeptidase YcbB
MEPASPSPVRIARRCSVLLSILLAAAPLPVLAQADAPPVEVQALSQIIAERAKGDLRAFYQGRSHRPLWVRPSGDLDRGALVLRDLVRTAEFDGLDPRALQAEALARAIERAEEQPSERNLIRAELALSQTFAAYVEAMRQSRDDGMTYVSPVLAPAAPTPSAALGAAAEAKSLSAYISAMGWMHPLYAPLRKAADGPLDAAERALVNTNLARLRAIPAQPAERYVLVNAANARLYMYEKDRVADSMKVVVGKVDNQTPMLAGFLRHAIVNPYWNIPVDLARTSIAPQVLEQGLSYLRNGGYQVMSTWDDTATVLDPATVDWQAVADGTVEVRVRQLPGRSNFMGRVKFEFPNRMGIYLHDTPDKHLMDETSRQFSSGCVRLEDAQRLGNWLMRKPLPSKVASPEQRFDLPQAVPVYITYLTAQVENGRIAFLDDPYGRDSPVLAGGDNERRSR